VMKGLAGRLGDGTWSAEKVAQGIIDICNSQMERALRVISLERGHDTRDFPLVTFGGAGGLHACDLARSLMIPRVIVPLNPGALSALGILHSDVVKDASRTILSSNGSSFESDLGPVWRELEDSVLEQLAAEGFPKDAIDLRRSVDIRYRGQSWEINTPWTADVVEQFHQLHDSRYGYSNRSLEIEIVNARVRGRARRQEQEFPRFAPGSERPSEDSMIQQTQVMLAGKAVSASFYVRSRLQAGNRIAGPAVILEYSSTTLIPDDFEAYVDEWLNLILEPIDQIR